MGLIVTLFIGMIIGLVASRLMGSGMSLVACMIVGIVGSFLGHWLAGVLGIGAYGSLGAFIVSVVGAMLLIALLRAVR